MTGLCLGHGSRRCLGATQTAIVNVEFFPARWIVVSTMSLGGCFLGALSYVSTARNFCTWRGKPELPGRLLRTLGTNFRRPTIADAIRQ